MRTVYYIEVAYELIRSAKIGKLFRKQYEDKSGKWKLEFIGIHDLLAIKEVVFDNDYLKGYSRAHAPKVVVDVGAGVGDFCLKVHLDFPKAKIWAFEPNQVSFKALRKNLQANKINSEAKNQKVSGLEDVFKEVGLIDILKIDCEGDEFKILRDKVYLRKIKFITGEYHEKYGDVAELTRRLTRAGFEVKLSSQREVPGLGLFTARRV